MTDIGKDAPALVLARRLLALRRRIAPPDSMRERLLRAIYIPWISRMKAREHLNQIGESPKPTVVTLVGTGPASRYLPRTPRILILKLDHLGDFVLALPAFEHLRDGFHDADITLVCGSWNHAWAAQCGLFDRVVAFDLAASDQNGRPHTAIAEQIEAFERLQLGPYDLAIDLRHDSDTRFLLDCVDTKFRAGYCAPPDAGGASLDLALPDMEQVSVATGTGRPVHAELRVFLLASAVTAMFSRGPHPARLLRDSRTPGERLTQPYAILAPGAGSPIRVWPLDRMTAVARALHQRHGLAIVVTGGPSEHAAGEQIIATLPTEAARNLADGLPLADLPNVIRGARLYIGLDTGTTHLASSLGVPTVAITSGVPELEVWHAQGKHTVVVAGRMPCSPCYLTHASQCPYGVACLNVISTDDVLSACDTLLHSTATQSISAAVD